MLIACTGSMHETCAFVRCVPTHPCSMARDICRLNGTRVYLPFSFWCICPGMLPCWRPRLRHLIDPRDVGLREFYTISPSTEADSDETLLDESSGGREKEMELRERAFRWLGRKQLGEHGGRSPAHQPMGDRQQAERRHHFQECRERYAHIAGGAYCILIMGVSSLEVISRQQMVLRVWYRGTWRYFWLYSCDCSPRTQHGILIWMMPNFVNGN